jgi:hypothetical protein
LLPTSVLVLPASPTAIDGQDLAAACVSNWVAIDGQDLVSTLLSCYFPSQEVEEHYRSHFFFFTLFRPIITVRPKKSLKAAGQSIFLSKHPLHVDQLYGVFDTKKNWEII